MAPRRPRARSTGADLPDDPVVTSTGTARLVVEPDQPNRVTLMVNGVPSSHLDLDDPTWLEFEYMQQMAAVVDLLPSGPVRAVHLGAAGCSLARWVHATRPGSRQLAVDVDDRLVQLVRTWFDLPRSPALRLRVQDAALTVRGLPDGAYDVVVRDVFAGDATPDALCTVGTAEQVRRALSPGGVYLANCGDRPPLRLARAEAATLSAVFDRVVLMAEPGVLKGRRHGNVVLAAAGTAGPDLTGAGLVRALRSLAVPVRLLAGRELVDFVAGAGPLRDVPAATHDEAAPPGGSAASS